MPPSATDRYQQVVRRTWRPVAVDASNPSALLRELVRCATLAPSSHNTQCWRFHAQAGSISIRPDFARRCPAVDPDDHHLFISLGCAAENLVQAALAHGWHADARFDPAAGGTLRLPLEPTRAVASTLVAAIPERQNTRGTYDGKPTVPSWLGRLLFGLVYTPGKENDKAAQRIRSASGIAVFASEVESPEQWIEVGRCYERFALQATALGIHTSMLNQPVEVTALRPQFGATLGLAGRRPDLVVRFGRGPKMPPSLRRPLDAVLMESPA